MNIEGIHALIRDNPKSADGYPQQVRDAVGRYALRRRDAGVRWRELEAEVGVSCTSMRIWTRALHGARFHQVAVVDEPAVVEVVPETLVITSPSGFTLTGCTLEQAATVMRRLR